MDGRGDRGRQALAGREIILETIGQGDMMRVAAVDVATGVEAHALGPVSAMQADLERIALGKLERRLRQQGHLNQTAQPGRPSRRGRWI